MKPVAIMYHEKCLDGFGSAWVGWRVYGSSADYIGVSPQSSAPNISGRDIVYCFDVSFSDEDIKRLEEDNTRLVMIDHHITSQEGIESVKEHVFDIDHSACVLVWKYFFPDAPVPLLLKHIEDIDIWKFALPHTQEVNILLYMMGFDFEKWSEFSLQLEDPTLREKIYEKAEVLGGYQDYLVERIASRAIDGVFEGHEVKIVNSPVFVSEIGHLLCEYSPVAIIWYESGDERRVSLRSDGSVDVSDLAEKYGGGGHREAAAFRVQRKDSFPWEE